MTDQAPCALYYHLPEGIEADAIAPFLPDLLENAPCEAFRIGTTDPAATRRAIATLRPILHQYDVALMLTGQPALARQSNCDGTQIDPTVTDAAQARTQLGKDLQLGVACGLSRDAAMLAGETGADYIAFEGNPTPLREQTQWWASVMELPAVAHSTTDIPAALALAEAGADFLAIDLTGSADQIPALEALYGALMGAAHPG